MTLTTDISALTALNDGYEPLYAWATSLPKHRCPKAPAWCDVCQRYVKRRGHGGLIVTQMGDNAYHYAEATGPMCASVPVQAFDIEMHVVGSNRVAVHHDGECVIMSVDEANKLKNDYAMGYGKAAKLALRK